MKLIHSREGSTYLLPLPTVCYCCIAYYGTDINCLTASVYVTGAGIGTAPQAAQHALTHFQNTMMGRGLKRIEVLPEGSKRWDNVQSIHTMLIQ
jgi:hypothetical protein